MEKFKIEIDRSKIVDTIQNQIQDTIKSELYFHDEDIKEAIKKHFEISFTSLKSHESLFSKSLMNCFEISLNKGIKKACDDIGLDNLLYDKCKEILCDKDLIHEIALDRIKKNLGIKELEKENT